MASEGFEAYHVPQQSRRDRLRGGGVSDCTTFYNDPSLLTTTTIPSDLLLLTHKQKSLHFMDPQISSSNSFQEINNPFLYSTHQNRLHFLDHHGVDMVHKQEHIYSSANDQPNMIINDNNNNNNDSNNSSSSNYVTTGQGLSLSLSSHNHHHHNQHQRSTTVPLELNLQRYDQSSSFTTVTAASCCNNNLSSKGSCSTILGPFTGYALILKGSRFLKPAEQLLEEICDAGNKGIYGEKLLEDDDDDDMMDPTTDATDDDASEHRSNKSKLISMLDEVYRRYKQYSQQLQGVVASFESVPGLGHAAPFANLSLKALSKHFRYLKNAISDQLNHTIKSHTHNHSSQINCDDSTTTRPVGKGSLNYNNFQRAAIQNAGIGEHQPVWRPQRGLPERAVTVLRAWLFDHFLHPYPTDSDKVMLAKQTGLSRNQVSNWFINARVRLWKPMVEEIHMLETRQAHKSDSQRQGQNNYNPVEYFPTSNDSLPSDQNRSTSAQQFPSKRTRSNDPADQMNLSYDNFSPRSRVGVDQVMSAPSGGNGGVSLTLELHHQNNSGVGMGGLSSEPFPRNAARRFGIDASNEVLILGGGFEAQNHQLGRDHNNIIGGQWQLLHDFVG